MPTLLSKKDQIAQALIVNITKRTPTNIKNTGGFDFTPGSPLRAMLEGFAVQADSIKKDISSTFYQERLNAMKIMAGVDNNPASKASGTMDITCDTDFTLVAGTPVMSSAQGKPVAEVITDVIFDGDPTPELKTVNIISNDAGSEISFAISDLYFAAGNLTGTNVGTINNGKDAESNYELVQRIHIALLGKKEATVAAITAKASAVKLYDGSGNVIEEVNRVLMTFPWQTDPEPLIEDVGNINLYILSSLGASSVELLAAIDLALLGSTFEDGVQAAGMDIKLTDSPKKDIAFTVGGVVIEAGFTFEPDVRVNIEGAIADYIKTLGMGEPINPTNWQVAAAGATGVDYFDEGTLLPSSQQTLAAFETWNVISYTVTE